MPPRTTKTKVANIPPSHVTANPGAYNSYFHTSLSAPDLTIPSEAPYAYDLWLPLITRSQRLPPSAIQTVVLSPSQVRLLITASQSSLQTGVLNRAFKEELEEEILPLIQNLNFNPTDQAPGGLFLRLSACSPKDSLAGGNKPIFTPQDIILRLTTSARAVSAFQACLSRSDRKTKLFFLPHNPRMSTAREFRVFCRPGRQLQITGVSQYKWHAPFFFADSKANLKANSKQDVDELVGKIMDGICEIHGQIVGVVHDALECTKLGLESTDDGSAPDKQNKKRRKETPGDRDAHLEPAMAEMLLKQGCTFDVMWDEEMGKASLIELNTFGARSGCGSCLFHWMRDREVLYGENGEDRVVEFRVSTADGDKCGDGDDDDEDGSGV